MQSNLPYWIPLIKVAIEFFHTLAQRGVPLLGIFQRPILFFPLLYLFFVIPSPPPPPPKSITIMSNWKNVNNWYVFHCITIHQT